MDNNRRGWKRIKENGKDEKRDGKEKKSMDKNRMDGKGQNTMDKNRRVWKLVSRICWITFSNVFLSNFKVIVSIYRLSLYAHIWIF